MNCRRACIEKRNLAALKNNELHFKVMQALCDRIIVFI
jgi:hypothetical protein